MVQTTEPLSDLIPHTHLTSNLSRITACTDKLRQNDPGFVELSLERKGDDFDIDDFVYSLKCNQTVKHVCFSGTFIRELEDEQWDSILESIGHLQTLEELVRLRFLFFLNFDISRAERHSHLHR